MIARETTRTILVLAAVLPLMAEPSTNPKTPFTARQRNHWAFQPVRHPAAPPVQRAGWVRNPIDAFILAKLEAQQLTPSPPADRATWLRRVSFDLVGLPPLPNELQAFLDDKSPDAYQKVVDRLLASPQYGERQGRHWLDLARYADSDGFKADATRPNIWRYRDYVIQSFNADKPYDRFVREQIAGDEIWPNSLEARVATGFNRHYPEEYNAQNLRQRRQDTLNDITDTVGATFLGLTFGCAKCHDHKFDPILQSDYYRLQAFFANVSAVDNLPVLDPQRLAEYQAKLAVWQNETKTIRDQMEALLEPVRKKSVHSRYMAYAPDVQAAVDKPASARTPLERWMAHRAEPFLTLVDETDLPKALKGDDKTKYEALAAELKKFDSLYPGDRPEGSCMTELSREAPPTSTLAVGNYDKPLQEVGPGFPLVLNPPAPEIAPPAGLQSTGRRTALANWIADPANPLTARVIVNRIWQHHFGKGIVSSPSDFGIMGGRPSHPELLDWLAAEFVKSGWSMKHMHRLIVTSNAYRQSSAFRADVAAIDSSDKYLWRYPRQRLDAEVIRDSALSVSGLLNLKMGGPGVYPELPGGMPAPRGGWDTEKDASERDRRSVYIFVRRNTRYPMLEVFDLATAQETCPRRDVTTIAPQALTLLNDKLSREWAEAFAARVIREAGPQFAAQMDRAYILAYARHPDSWEKDAAFSFLDRQVKLLAERDASGAPLSNLIGLPAGTDRFQTAALVDFCQALMNSNEFVYEN
jgi:hypothetical protein